MIEDSIRNIKEQLLWIPQVQNIGGLRARGKIILCGMGGSRIASGFLKTLRPDMDIEIWNDYGLPRGYARDAMVIVSSYSGNTEEAIGNFHSALQEGLQIAVVSGGGKLLLLAKENGVPYVELPSGHHPRMTAVYHLKALITLLGENSMRDEMNSLAESLDMGPMESAGKAIGENMTGIPLIYASNSNWYLAEYFKISFNETSKVPAFSNVIPELAHNELSGLKQPMNFILIHDPDDHPRVQLKLTALESLLKEKDYLVFDVNLSGSALSKLLTSYVVASWSALYLARKLNANPEEQELVEEFKKRVQ